MKEIFTSIFAIIFYVYFGIILIYTIWLYSKLKVYYRKLTFKKTPDSEEIDVGDLYDEFKMTDNLSFFRLFFGNFFITVFRGPLDIMLALLQNFCLKSDMKNLKNPTTDQKDWEILSKTISKYTSWFFCLNGIKIIKKELPYEEIYKKYLGDDYDFTDQKYSIIICNHIGFFEVLINMVKNQSGFFAKKEIESYAFVGPIAKAMNCLFVNRESDEERAKLFKLLEQRQKDFYEGKILAPLVLFPEGTTTCGRNLLKFKKGAFYSLLPIKPELVKINQKDDFSCAVGSSHVVLNFFRSMAYFRHKLYFIDLPVIRPTEFMFEKYKDLGKEKWEIFAEVTRKILCEIGDFKPSNKMFRDLNRYKKAMKNGVYTSEDFLSLCNEKDPVVEQLGIKI